jgi:6-pyruvoyl-tetrahydropterin synthase related domain
LPSTDRRKTISAISGLTKTRSGTASRGGSLFFLPLLIILSTAFAVVLPWLFLGIPSGHDFEFHVNSWMEVLGQWRQGIVYPRWAALAHFGYGEARFIFYPPFSWLLGALLGAVLPWKLAPAAFALVALTLSGCSMFRLARQYLSRGDAVFAAALYAANPYHLVIVYWRSAFAELLAAALLPLLWLQVLQVEERGRRVVVPLALLVAAAWLTNAPAAVMVNYSLALLITTVAILKRSPEVLLYGAAAAILGATLAALYVLPAAYEQKWVEIAQVLAPGVRPQDNFLFTILEDVDHNRFNFLVSLVAAMQMVALAGAALLTRARRQELPQLGWTATTWALCSALLMFSFTFFLWEHLPKLRFVQLPWRWLLCLNVPFALVITLAWWRLTARVLLSATLLFVLLFTWHRVQAPWWDTAADINETFDNQQAGRGYEGTDEYVPAGADPYEIDKQAHRVSFEGVGYSRIEVKDWGAESKFFIADVTSPGTLVLRLFNYPAWRLEVNGHSVASQTREVTGQLMIPLKAGQNQVRIRFIRTWDRTLGGIISALAALFVLIVCLFFKNASSERLMRRILIATSNPGKLRDFAGAASSLGIETDTLPGLGSLPAVVEESRALQSLCSW